MTNLLETLSSVTLFGVLYLLDIQLAEGVRKNRCPCCGGPLHYARYPRDPAGSFVSLPDEFRMRQGLCCGHCRRRQLPPSCLFMGRYGAYRCAILVFLTKPVAPLHISDRVEFYQSTDWINPTSIGSNQCSAIFCR